MDTRKEMDSVLQSLEIHINEYTPPPPLTHREYTLIVMQAYFDDKGCVCMLVCQEDDVMSAH